jgi:murein L,D-transpeptidase YcbB/YkuD
LRVQPHRTWTSICTVTSLVAALAGAAIAEPPAWSEAAAARLRQALAEAPSHGLDGDVFPRLPLHDARSSRELLTETAIEYARIMANGQIDPAEVTDKIDVPRPRAPDLAELRAALEQDRFDAWLTELPPRAAGYQQLRGALLRYRTIVAHGGWPIVDAGPTLAPDVNDARVPLLARRLQIEGDLAAFDGSASYGPDIVAAVRRFQSRHGLTRDGKVGPATRAALNVTAGERLDQIIANLERWRWFARVTPPTRVELNAAAAMVRLFRAETPVLTMKAVVGKPRSPTPFLLATIQDVTFNPSWFVPPSITRHEILPLLRRDPGYLARNRMQWRDNGQLVQLPGPDNALGRIKFEMPNRFNVYLHDTPVRSLFTQDDRARSHGCVRLELPAALAEELLHWRPERIEGAIAAGATVRVPLSETIPVFLAYWTAFTDEDGMLQFRHDVYGRDRRLIEAMRNKRLPLIAGRPGAIGCGRS